jgi:hypothetical protein
VPAHLCTLNAQHPVDAVGPAAVTTTPGWWAVAHHDIVLILHFAFAVTEVVLINQLNDSRQLRQRLRWLLGLRSRRER